MKTGRATGPRSLPRRPCASLCELDEPDRLGPVRSLAGPAPVHRASGKPIRVKAGCDWPVSR